MSQTLIDQVEFAENAEARCPVVLVLDTSQSMEGAPIQELNEGIQKFGKALKQDKLAALRVEVAIITFGGKVQAIDVRAGQVQPIPFDAREAFVVVDNFQPPTLTEWGHTPMGEAVSRALALLRERKEIYKQNDIDYYRPWLVLITDGYPTDEKGHETNDWLSAAQEVKNEETRKGVVYYGIGVEEARMSVLHSFTNEKNRVYKLKGFDFGRLFVWLSKSLSAVAHSELGGKEPQVPLPDWAQNNP